MIKLELINKTYQEIRASVYELYKSNQVGEARLLVIEYLETLSSCFYEDPVEGTAFDDLMIEIFKTAYYGLQKSSIEKFTHDFYGCKRIKESLNG